MDQNIVKKRKRSLKLFFGKAKSQLLGNKGEMVPTIVAATSRQQALKLLLSSNIKVPRRVFFKWAEEDSGDYRIPLTVGVWQSNQVPFNFEKIEEKCQLNDLTEMPIQFQIMEK